MKLITVVNQSAKSLFANKVRSLLTILGIVIGIGAVIGLVSLGTGVQQSIGAEIQTLGSTTITVISGGEFNRVSSNISNGSSQSNRGASFGTVQTLTQEDLLVVQDISKALVSKIAGVISSTTVISIDDTEYQVNLQGIAGDYFEINDSQVARGELFDNASEEPVIVLGDSLSEQLFAQEDPLGQQVTIKDVSFTVVGILEPETESNFSFNSANTRAFIPASQAIELLDTTLFSTFSLKASDDTKVAEAKAEIKRVLMESHNIGDEELIDFSVTTAEDLLSTVNQITGILTSLLSGIAAISLLVGGIGIMNIMLVSVTERTREIGLRKAVGAKTRDILIQFLIEAVMLTVVGGILGILLGFGISTLAGKLLELEAVITIDVIALAVSVSTVIGIVFGMYPAARAARLNPIDALRYE